MALVIRGEVQAWMTGYGCGDGDGYGCGDGDGYGYGDSDGRDIVSGGVSLEERDALRADLDRVEQERDAERANANEWLAKCYDAEKRAERWANEEGKTANANIQLEAELLDAHQRIADLEAAKRDAYNQRDELAVLCARMARAIGYSAGWGRHNGPPFQDRPYVLRIGLPAGDVSYHLRENDARIDNMPAWSWDSADKEENRRRVRDTTIRNRRADDAEAKLAEALSPLALAERRYAQAWWAREAAWPGDGDYWDAKDEYIKATEALRDAYAAAAKGEGGEGER